MPICSSLQHGCLRGGVLPVTLAYPGILKGTGHCTEGRMVIDGRWAPQIGNWLIRRFFCMQSCSARFLGLVLAACWFTCATNAVMPPHSTDWMGAQKPKVQGMSWMPVCWVRHCPVNRSVRGTMEWRKLAVASNMEQNAYQHQPRAAMRRSSSLAGRAKPSRASSQVEASHRVSSRESSPEPSSDLEPNRVEFWARPSRVPSVGLVKAVKVTMIKSGRKKWCSLASHAKRIKTAFKLQKGRTVDIFTLTRPYASICVRKTKNTLPAQTEQSHEPGLSRVEPSLEAPNRAKVGRAPNRAEPSRSEPRAEPSLEPSLVKRSLVKPSRVLSPAE